MLCRCGRYHIRQKHMREDLIVACTSRKNQCYSRYKRHILCGFMIDNGYHISLRLDRSFYALLTIIFPKEFTILLVIRGGTVGLTS